MKPSPGSAPRSATLRAARQAPPDLFRRVCLSLHRRRNRHAAFLSLFLQALRAKPRPCRISIKPEPSALAVASNAQPDAAKCRSTVRCLRFSGAASVQNDRVVASVASCESNRSGATTGSRSRQNRARTKRDSDRTSPSGRSRWPMPMIRNFEYVQVTAPLARLHNTLSCTWSRKVGRCSSRGRKQRT